MSLNYSHTAGKRVTLRHYAATTVTLVLITIGVFAKNGWFPSTDSLTGVGTGWFGVPTSSLGSSYATAPEVVPLLSKEYIYAGTRILAVEDANANPVSPSDLAVWRPSTGTWWVMGGAAGSQPATQAWGVAADDPVPGDYDGDGKTDFSIFRPSSGEWYVIRSSDHSWDTVIAWGLSSDVRVPADYDGDGKTDRAVWRASDGTWYIVRSSDGVSLYRTFGANGDIPAAADYDGDGRADLAVFRNADQKFYWVNSSTGSSSSVALGHSGTRAVSADYDGDGKADQAVRNGASWIIRQSSNAQVINVAWQKATDIAVHNDYDADGKVDIAVWRPSNSPAGTIGNWFIRQSAAAYSLRQVQWGIAGDIPVPAFYRR